MGESGSLEHAGCRIAYRVRGSGPPVVWIQGVGLHGDGWTLQTEALQSRYRCASFDNRGMGDSQPPGERVTVEGMAGDVLALMDHLDMASAHLVGHSLGGLVAMHVALEARMRVRSLALLCTVARGFDASRPTWAIVRLGMAAAFGSLRARRHAFLRLIYPPDFLAAHDLDELATHLEPFFGHDLGVQPSFVNHQLRALRAYSAQSRLNELSGIPTLVVSAGHDPVAAPRFGRALAAGIPDARFVEVPDAAHGVMIQCAERINAELEEHFELSDNGGRRSTQ